MFAVGRSICSGRFESKGDSESSWDPNCVPTECKGQSARTSVNGALIESFLLLRSHTTTQVSFHFEATIALYLTLVIGYRVGSISLNPKLLCVATCKRHRTTLIAPQAGLQHKDEKHAKPQGLLIQPSSSTGSGSFPSLLLC